MGKVELSAECFFKMDDINDTLGVGKCSYESRKFLTKRQVAAGL